jgi:hypothetical protein
MGYAGHDDWRDMSDYVVHFTKPIPAEHIGDPPPAPARKGKLTLGELLSRLRYEGRKDRSGFTRWKSILGEGTLHAGDKPLGAGRNIGEVADRHRVVCFSEIPLDMLDRLIERRSLYGVGFRKNWIVSRGGAPLWYLDKGGTQAALVHALVEEKGGRGDVDSSDPLWKITPFIDNPGVYFGKKYRFEWEREWRVVGDLAFAPDDVAFLFLPEEEHDQARQFFADVEVEQTGPSYFCSYIDPRWEMDRIQDALLYVAPVPEASDSEFLGGPKP